MDEVADHPLMPALRLAYASFRAGNVRAAVEQLAPALATDAAKQPAVVAGALWGLAGDCAFKLGEIDRGFAAYRQAIALDPQAGCLTLFARQVAAHRRAEDAAFALQCLGMARASDWAALRRYPVHFLLHSIAPDALYFRFAVLPCVRWRLRRLAAGA